MIYRDRGYVVLDPPPVYAAARGTPAQRQGIRQYFGGLPAAGEETAAHPDIRVHRTDAPTARPLFVNRPRVYTSASQPDWPPAGEQPEW